jgi:hypothetical protein
MDFREIGCEAVHWIQLAQYLVQWRIIENTDRIIITIIFIIIVTIIITVELGYSYLGCSDTLAIASNIE